ncbi:prepilin-type N-terminal cleavage/methylation domain-containing protein [Geovibrio thiophilus]|uniref:Prepilin-type N-terminal cleavage/methylation domain-containing protein n=1 Tax=Geovibrio thiophilus TaxID=139438 RepID=A0A410K0I8_9BACT|nr:prepilin-type N-terminal cleavage/methylation domain-containing protein [Geovibrio thiophilus]QAR33956.1 prepilin-type N-terminal cleavage/methylation domain-containing protein [Geovibrio thiophilus]
MNAAAVPEKGFSLIELIFVIVVIGFLASFGYGMMNNAKNFSSERNTDAALNEVLLRASSEAAAARRMPTPSFFGEIKDGYGRNLRIMTADSADICSGSGGIPVTLCRNADCTEKEVFDGAAVFAVSAGEDGVFTTIADQTAVTVYPASQSNDDKTGWTGLNEIARHANCGEAFKIVTPQLPPVYSGSLYTAEIQSVPPAEKWCAESDPETAAMLNIRTDCSDESSYTEGSSLLISSFADVFSTPSVREVKAYALTGGRRASAVYAVPFYQAGFSPPQDHGFRLRTDNLSISNAEGGQGEGISPAEDENGDTTGFEVEGNPSAKSVCMWINNTFSLNEVFRMYYEVRTGYSDSDPLSTESSFGGYGLIVYPADQAGENMKCGLSGSSGLGYGGLSFDGLGFVLETDLYPDRNLDFSLYPSPNHLAVIPCAYPSGSKKICLGAHLSSVVPSCPDDSGCAEPDSSSVNWLEDKAVHPMRLEIHSGYADGACSSKSADGDYMLVKAWTDCKLCSELSYNYSGEKPSVSQCIPSGGGRMKSFRLGFTFGGETGSLLSFQNMLLSIR